MKKKVLKKVLGALMAGIIAVFTATVSIYAENTVSSSVSEKAVSEESEKLPAPTLKIKKTKKDEITLSWGKVEGAVKYQVYYSTEKGKEYKIARTTRKTTCTVTKLEQATDYYFKIRAVSEDYIKGNFSKVKKATTKGYKSESFTTDDFIISITNTYGFSVVNNRFSDYNRKSVVALKISVKNISDENEYFSPLFNIDVYDPDGLELDCLDSYFDNTVDIKLRPGAKKTGYFYFPYVGDGEYVINIDPWGINEEKVIIIEKEDAN